MQLKTDKCNFIHLGRCVKGSAPNIPHDSPWLISPWSETPIISHEPNSTRMARRSPRGQFSGHLPPHSLQLSGREKERRGASCQGRPEACTHGGGEGEGPKLKGEERRRRRKRRRVGTRRKRPLAGCAWRWGGGGEWWERHGKILKRGNKEDKEKI